MKTRSIPAIVIFLMSLTVVFSTAYAGQDNKSTVKALTGSGFLISKDTKIGRMSQ